MPLSSLLVDIDNFFDIISFHMEDKMKKKILVMAIGAIISIPSFADTLNESMNVNATLNRSCTIKITDFHFGELATVTEDIQIPGKITTLCSKGISTTLIINDSDYKGQGSRKMYGSTSAHKLGYNLVDYRNYVFVVNTFWSGNVIREMIINGTGKTVETVLNAQIPRNQFVKPESYSETVTANLYY